jgi:hypothetical protein
MIYDPQSLLFPNERIAWELDIHDGIIHRQVKASYYITNLRLLCVDRIENKIISSLAIDNTDLVVMDSARGFKLGWNGCLQGMNLRFVQNRDFEERRLARLHESGS